MAARPSTAATTPAGWTIYLTPWACGRDGGLSLGPFEDAENAMATADRYVAAHLDGRS
ncbi:MAG: hypothetical protein ACRD0W_20295 [Acidimicrobiales bacterium]